MKNILPIFLMISFHCAGQNVGIGTTTPDGKLEVSGNSNTQPNLLITDSAYKGFGVFRFNHVDYPGRYMQFSGYKSVASTAETYLSLSSDSVPIVSFRGNGNVAINNAQAVYPLNVAGDVDIAYNGALRLNGNAGTPGQVVTSGGTGQPSQWANQAFTDKVRFYFNGDSFGPLKQDSLLFATTVYNLNPAAVVKTGKYITFNKAGLYHFDFYYGSVIGPQTYPPTASLYLAVSTIPDQTFFSWAEPYRSYSPNAGVSYNFWRFNLHESKEIYLTAGTTIAVYRNNELVAGAASLDHIFSFSGYLISD